VKIADVQLRGMPEALLPGEPYCAPASVVIAESVSSLLRTLHAADQAWNVAVSSAVIDRLQHVDSLTALLSRDTVSCDTVGGDSDRLTSRDDVTDADSCDKAVTVSDDVIETVGEKDALTGNVFRYNQKLKAVLYRGIKPRIRNGGDLLRCSYDLSG